MVKNNNKFYVTTPIYYASGKPHLGHAYTSIAAEILAKWNRQLGKNVYFQTGVDEHGQKIVEKAKEAKKEPQIFVDLISKQFENLLKKLNISNDYFIRTTNKEHKKIVQEVLQLSFDNGDIYKDVYDGLYCVGCEKYYTKDELVDEKFCPDHKTEVEHKTEENYFFKLSKYQDKLLKFYKKNPSFISPKNKQKEILNRVKEGLNDISISRPKTSLTWGIELPFDKDHVSYVWFDALFNYYSGTKINDNNQWPADVHIVGHDISWFHLVYWPAFLMSIKIELPKKVFSHAMILDGKGHKMSKSLGNVIDPIKFSKKYGVDEFRYFLMASSSFGEDICFSEEKFAEKINNELNNDLGNLISRVHAMTTKYFDGVIPKFEKGNKVDEELIEKLNIFEKFNSQIQDLKFNQALETLFFAIRETNAYINKVSPWKEENKERLGSILNLLCSSSILFAKYINCFMPEKSKKIFKQFNMENNNKFELEFFKEGHKLGIKENLFEKIKLEKKEDKSKQVQKKEEKPRVSFEKMNLKIGKILSVEKHPEAEKLFVEQIDVGEEKPRQIVSGLANYYTLDKMKGKQVVVVCNLKPAKLRGIKSFGMVLVAENEKENTLGLLISNAKVGTHLVCDNKTADNPSRIKIDDFFKLEMISNGEKINFEGKEVKAGEKELKIDRKIIGKVC